MGTGEVDVLPADLVVRSVGYFGMPLPGPAGRRAHRARCRTRPGGCSATDGPRPASTWRAGSSAGPAASSAPTSTTPGETVASLLADAAEGRSTVQGPVGDLVGGAGRPRRGARADRRLAGDRRRRGRPRRDARPGAHDAARAGGAAGRRPRRDRPADLRRQLRPAGPGAARVGRRRDEPDAVRRVSRRRAAAARRPAVSATPPAASSTASPPATSCTWLPLRSTSCQAAAEPSATRHRSIAVQPVIRTRRAVAGRRRCRRRGRWGRRPCCPRAERPGRRPAGRPPRRPPPTGDPRTGRRRARRPAGRPTPAPRRTPTAAGRRRSCPCRRADPARSTAAPSATGASGRSSLSTGTPERRQDLDGRGVRGRRRAGLPSSLLRGPVGVAGQGHGDLDPGGGARGEVPEAVDQRGVVRRAGTGTVRPVVAWQIGSQPQPTAVATTAGWSSGTPARCRTTASAVPSPAHCRRSSTARPASSASSRAAGSTSAGASATAGRQSRSAAARSLAGRHRGAQLRISHCCAARSRSR